MFDGWAKPGNITTPLCAGEPEPPLSRQKSFRRRFYGKMVGAPWNGITQPHIHLV